VKFYQEESAGLGREQMENDVERFLSSLPPQVQEIARTLRERIRETVPSAVEQRHGGWKVIGYSWDGSMTSSICAIAPHSKHVNLQFFRGTELDDPDGLLSGTGRRARHVKLQKATDVKAEGVAGLISQAADLARGG
jgi:hypothetical protein